MFKGNPTMVRKKQQNADEQQWIKDKVKESLH